MTNESVINQLVG